MELKNFFPLLPGFPGEYTWTQIKLLLLYASLIAYSFLLFQLSVLQEYCLFTLSINWWLGLCIYGMLHSYVLVASYYQLAKHNKPIGDPQVTAAVFDAPRALVAAIAMYYFDVLTWRILGIYFYTASNPDYLTLLNQNCSRLGYRGFVQDKMYEFLVTCQHGFQLQFAFALIEYIIFPMKHKLRKWQQRQNNQ